MKFINVQFAPLPCVGYAQNSLEFISRSPLIRGRPKLLPVNRQPICSNW